MSQGLMLVVGTAGFDPATPCLQTKPEQRRYLGRRRTGQATAAQPDSDPAILEARHRLHAHVEDRIRAAKASGLRNLPLWGFGANDAWLTLVCWAQAPTSATASRSWSTVLA